MLKDKIMLNIRSPDKECYFCGRTEKDLNKINEHVKDAYDDAIDHVESLRKHHSHDYKHIYKRILEDTEDVNLDISIRSVNADREGYAGRIPHLEEMLDYFYRYMARRSPVDRSIMNEKTRLSDVRGRILNAEGQEQNELNERHRLLLEARKLLNDVKGYGPGLHEVTFTLKELLPGMFPQNPETKVKKEVYMEFGEPRTDEKRAELNAIISSRVIRLNDMERLDMDRIKYTVYMCEICDRMFRNASRAAYAKARPQESKTRTHVETPAHDSFDEFESMQADV